MIRIVIHSSDLGVYLGCFIGLGFWSKLDPAGQEVAACFPSEGDAKEHTNTWEEPVEDLQFIRVEVSSGDIATIEECKRVGLPGWDPDTVPS